MGKVRKNNVIGVIFLALLWVITYFTYYITVPWLENDLEEHSIDQNVLSSDH